MKKYKITITEIEDGKTSPVLEAEYEERELQYNMQNFIEPRFESGYIAQVGWNDYGHSMTITATHRKGIPDEI